MHNVIHRFLSVYLVKAYYGADIRALNAVESVRAVHLV